MKELYWPHEVHGQNSESIELNYETNIWDLPKVKIPTRSKIYMTPKMINKINLERQTLERVINNKN